MVAWHDGIFLCFDALPRWMDHQRSIRMYPGAQVDVWVMRAAGRDLASAASTCLGLGARDGPKGPKSPSTSYPANRSHPEDQCCRPKLGRISWF